MEGGSRLVINKTTLTRNGQNYCTCLPESVPELLPAETRQLVHSSMVAPMSVEGGTLILNIAKAPRVHGLSLELGNRDYIKEGNASFSLLQKRDCKLVVQIKLTNLKGNLMSHLVTWDGNVITDSPHKYVANITYNRTNSKKSKRAFLKLYPSNQFKKWKITSMYNLRHCKHQNTTHRQTF